MEKDTQGRIPSGSLLSDLRNNKWIIKSFIGIAGSAENYTAALGNDKAPTDYSVIIKIEPYKNESLSLSMQFCINNTTLKDINKWINVNNIHNGLAIPRLLGLGTHIYNRVKYYFIVTNQYDSNLWKLFLENGRQFPAHTVYKAAFQTLRVLEYIHKRGYVHADVKGANLLLKNDHPYLAMSDSMLHYPTKDCHVYPKQADYLLVVEYSSRDHHIGIPTMRGDLEMLLYNMIQWLCSDLPWDNHLNNPCKVQQMKKDAFKDCTKFLQECFKKSEVPAPISKFMSLLAAIDRCEEPPYKKFLGVLRRGLRKLGHIPSGSLQYSVDESDEEKPESLSVAENDNRMDCNNAECEPTKDTLDGVTLRRSLRLMKKPKQKVANRAKSIKRKIEVAVIERLTRRRKRKTKSSVHKKSEQLDESDEEVSVGNENSSREQSPSPCRRSRSSPVSPTRLASSRIRSASTSESNRVYRPVSRASSSGFSSRSSSRIVFHSSPLRTLEGKSQGKVDNTFEWLDAPVQEELRILRDEFNAQQSRLNALAKLLTEVPEEWDDSEKLIRIAQDWRKQLEERAQKLSDACLGKLRNVLQGLSDHLDKLTLNKDTEEQLLHKVEALVSQLEGQRTQLANARTMAQQLCRIFNDSALSSEVPVKLRSVDKLYLDLQKKIDLRKSEVDKTFSDRRQFDDSCKELLVWLTTELDAMEKVLVSTDRVMLRQQLEYHKVIHQRVMSKETEAMKVLKKGREGLTRSSNIESRTIQKRYLDVMQSKWDLLKMRSLKLLKKLQTCFELSEKYYQAQVQFSAWLSEAEAKLESLKLALSKHEDDIKNQLEELSILSNEVREKSHEFEQSTSFGDALVDSCDVDEDDVVKNELVSTKGGWRRLNNELLKRTRSLEDIYSQLVGLNNSLRDLKHKLVLYENELASNGDLRTTVKGPNLLDRIEKLLEKTDILSGSLNILRQRAIGLARKQATDVDHLLDDMNSMIVRIASLKAKLGDLCNEILEVEQLDFERRALEMKPIDNTMEEQIDEKPLNLFVPSNISWIPGEIVDLVSSDESDVELSLTFEGSFNTDESAEESRGKSLKKKEDFTSGSNFSTSGHDKNNNMSLSRNSQGRDSDNGDNLKSRNNSECDGSCTKSNADPKYPTTPSSSYIDNNPSRPAKFKYFTDSDDYILTMPKHYDSGQDTFSRKTTSDCRQGFTKNSRKVHRKSDQNSNSRRISPLKRFSRFKQSRFLTCTRSRNINPLSRSFRKKNSSRRLMRKFRRGQMAELHGSKKDVAEQDATEEQESQKKEDEAVEKDVESGMDGLEERDDRGDQRKSDFSEMNVPLSIVADEENFELEPLDILEDIMSMCMGDTEV